MSLTQVRPFLLAMVALVEPALQEWTDEYNSSNIPSTILDKSFHVELGTFGQITQNQHHAFQSEGFATLKLWQQGANDPQKAVDANIARGEAIIQEVMKSKNRNEFSSGIKNVRVSSFTPTPISASNDNVSELIIVFEFLIFINISQG